MSSIDFGVRWQDNTSELSRNLALGLAQINATQESVDKLTKSLSGETQIRAADRWAQALQKLGGEAGALAGVQSLTTAEQERGSAVIDKAIAKYQALGVTAPKALVDISDALHGASTATSGWGDILAELGHSWVARIAEGILLRDAIHEVIDKVKEMILVLPELALKGAAVADVEEAFNRLTTQSGRLGATLLGELKEGTHNTITDFQLMKTANQDLAAGMNLTDKQFGTLAKGAFALAQATGTDVKTALDTMNDAMLTGRTRALALLTGKIDLVAAEEKFAKSLGSTADHLSAEGKIEAARSAILQAVGAATERLGEQTDGLDERVAQAGVAWDNFRENLGKTIATSAVLEAGMSGLKDALIQTFGPSQDDLIKAIAHTVDDAAIAVIGLARSGVTAGGALATEWYALEKVFGNVAQIIQGNALAFEYLALGVAKAGAATSIGQVAQQRYADDVKRIDGNITSLLVTMKARGDALQDEDRKQASVGATTDKYTKLLDDLQAKMEAARKGATDFVGPLEDSTKAQQAAADAAARHSGLLQQSKKDIEEAARAAKAAAALWAEYNSVGQSVYDTYFQLDGRVAEGIANDLRRGVSIGTVTKAWQVHEAQVKAVEAQEKFLASTTDIAAKAGGGLYTVISNLADVTQPLSDRTLQFGLYMQGLTTDGLIPAAAGFDDLSRAEQGAALFAKRLQDSDEALQHQLASLIGLMPDLGGVARDTMAEAMKSTDKFHDSLQLAEHALSQLAGVNLAPLFKQFDQFLASPSGQALDNLLSGSGFSQPASAGGKLALAGVQAGAGAIANATDNPDTKGGQVANYAAKGAEYGAIAGPYGALIGAGVGAIVGALKVSPEEIAARSGLEALEKSFSSLSATAQVVGADVAAAADKTITKYGTLDAAIKTISASYANYGKSGAEAEADIKAALDASHVSAEAEAAALAKINAVMDASKLRSEEVAAAIQSIGPAFDSVVAGTIGAVAGYDKLSAAVASARDAMQQGIQDHASTDQLKKLQDALDTAQAAEDKMAGAASGTVSRWDEIEAAVTSATAAVKDSEKPITTTIDAIAGVAAGSQDAIQKATLGIVVDKGAVDNALAAYDKLAKAGKATGDELAAALAKVDLARLKVTTDTEALSKLLGVAGQPGRTVTGVDEQAKASAEQRLTDALDEQKRAADAAKQGLADLGVQAVASFASAVAGGSSVADALKAIGPGLDTLQKSYQDLGLNVDDVALKNLLMQNTITEGNPALLGAIAGLSSELQDLDKLGVLNTDTFAAMERTGEQAYTRLQSQVAAVGGSTKDALIPMQTYLHEAAADAKDLGVPLDDNTQTLITQSKELGIWKDTGKDATKSITDSVGDLIAKMNELIDRLAGPGGVTDSFSHIPSNIDVKVNFVAGDSVQAPGGFGISPENSFANGSNGIIDFGSGTPAMLHGREAVVREDQIGLGGPDASSLAAMAAQLKIAQESQERLARSIALDLPNQLARAVRDEVAKVRVLGSR